jgi:cell division protein FtsL
MIKFLHVVAIGALVASAGYAYSVKYETTLNAEQLKKLEANAARQRDAIAVLKAEWQHLTRPERVQALADRHLDLQPAAVSQVVRVSDIPMRGPKVDSIGRKLADLGLGAGTETPKETRIPAARTPGARP